MPDTVLVIITGVMVVASVGAWVYRASFSANGRARRTLRGARRVSIAAAPDGQVVKLVGRLSYHDDEPVVSPLGQRRCAYYRTIVEQQRKNDLDKSWRAGFVGEGLGNWILLIQESDFCHRLWIDDGTGRALVELVYPDVVLQMDARFRSGFLNDASPTLEALLNKHGESSQGLLFNRTLRYREGLLEPGETIAVHGLCRREPDPDPAAAGLYRDRPTRVRIIDPPGGNMLLSDDPKVL